MNHVIEWMLKSGVPMPNGLSTALRSLVSSPTNAVTS